MDVLIVGGSLVGLSAAMLLGWHGVRSIAVEQHASTAIHSRAGHFQLRTLEILRSAGLEEPVRLRSEQQYHPDGGINNVESLAGREIASYFANLNAGVDEFSPTVRLFIDQDALEPILRARAEELGAELRYRVECTALLQDDEGVGASLHDLDSGAQTTVRSRYVVAADGNRSPTRRGLGIAMRGHGRLSDSITIYFRSEVDLAPLLEGRHQGVNYVTNSVLRGFFRLDRTGNRGFLVVNLVGDSARPEIVAAYPDAPWANVAHGIDERRALELLRAAIGIPEIPVVIEDIATWRAVADSAERYGAGRVFLVGDAAHTVPPNGGFGGNTGVQDAHNLAWKLALVLRGVAGSPLDLFGRTFALLAGPGGEAWHAAAIEAADGLGAPLERHVVGGADWSTATGALRMRLASQPPGPRSSGQTASSDGEPETRRGHPRPSCETCWRSSCGACR